MRSCSAKPLSEVTWGLPFLLSLEAESCVGSTWLPALKSLRGNSSLHRLFCLLARPFFTFEKVTCRRDLLQKVYIQMSPYVTHENQVSM